MTTSSTSPTCPSKVELFEQDDLKFCTAITLVYVLGPRKVALENFHQQPHLKLLVAFVRNNGVLAVLPRCSAAGMTLLVGGTARPPQ